MSVTATPDEGAPADLASAAACGWTRRGSASTSATAASSASCSGACSRRPSGSVMRVSRTPDPRGTRCVPRAVRHDGTMPPRSSARQSLRGRLEPRRRTPGAGSLELRPDRLRLEGAQGTGGAASASSPYDSTRGGYGSAGCAPNASTAGPASSSSARARSLCSSATPTRPGSLRELAERLSDRWLAVARPASHLVVVAPLSRGHAASRRGELIADGPPFELDASALVQLDRVYLTEREAVFVFEGARPRAGGRAARRRPGHVARPPPPGGECLAGAAPDRGAGVRLEPRPGNDRRSRRSSGCGDSSRPASC